MPKPLIDMKNLTKTYTLGGETFKALDDVTFTVEQGEFLSIVGPSGSGKSTLMNMIGCLDVPDEGSYHLDDVDVFKLSDNKLSEIRNKKIGFIFQQFNLLPKLSAFENVELPLIYAGLSVSAREKAAIGCLEKVGLLEKRRNLPTQLSGGQQQRVAIARALAGKPQILLADEPTGALDSKTGKEVMGILQELNRAGNTIVMITHDPTIASYGTRSIRIQDGKLFHEEATQA
ncbi:macrolide ABC transporter ATP-binding protein [Listeria monocytogenes]|uniref:ABC transporter ATP-binding protein n=1 Tax=Listeria monocytogenes TaxID=1639 RepID=UPI00083DCE09|nr:ABC transporter ATP-binding protein [Listeria monocytogenes]EAC8769547.1 ABC transporter ATP-binding protein [Listeria monocytogenes]EAD1129596.1 ABC transporter ATP-binding protein [Listeria monocytogenes]ODB11609.1 macrolide ABC transporter ATP-binding protein [Listeria monocytogenes]ODB19678.1 macrolide ABC transporter ATP-binding protein [Listeria monocytogenes]ODB20627.1 macrolide ABC transporter ATP-binding protein [Listeria monocytogenes]